MKHLSSKLAASGMALALWLAPAWGVAVAQVSTPAPAARQYVVIDLTPAGSTTSSASGVSGAQQVGSASLPSPTAGQPAVSHAMLWSGGAAGVVDLGPGTAGAVGDGQQVGSSNGHAALWRGTAGSRVDLNPAQWTQSDAAGVGGGRQVGSATRNVVCTTRKGKCTEGVKSETHPFMWSGTAASAVDLTPLGLGFGAGRALGTDGVQQVGFGQQVLGTNSFSGPYAVLWAGSADSAVNLNPPDSGSSQANAVAGGQQVGFGYFPHRALLWRGSVESVVELHPDGYSASEANATNGFEQAGSGFVGDAFTQDGHSHALVWAGDAASVTDLNRFLPDGFTDAAATGINADGTVVGWASRGPSGDPANVHAVMWLPVASGAAFASTLSLDRTGIVGGEAARATVKLSQPAPQGGAVVSLSHTIQAPQGDTAAPRVTVQVPPDVLVPEGESAASFDVGTGVTTIDGFTRPYLINVQAAYGGTTPSATLTVAPPLYLSGLSVSPGSIVGGNTAVGTVALSGPAPAGGALVALAGDSTAASVPESVLVPEGQSGATFSVRTSPATSPVTVTLTASHGGAFPATATAKLVVTPPAAAQTDTVAIQRAEYVTSKRELAVQATSTSQTATLRVLVSSTGALIGTLTNRGSGRYEGTFTVATNPQNITVRSSLNGTASRAVTAK
jgi:hypothetical protein